MDSGQSLRERLKYDLRKSRSLMRIILSVFKEDLQKIYEEPKKIWVNCDINAVSRLACMIKDKFTDYVFLTGENRTTFLHISSLLRFSK